MKRRIIYQKIELDDIIYDTIDVKILEGIAIGKCREAIAGEVFLSKRSIDTRVDNMAKTFLVDGQLAVVLKAIALGIIKNPFEPVERPKAEYDNKQQDLS